MRGNGFVNSQPIGRGQAEVAREKSEMARRALRLQPFDSRRRRAADCQAGRWAVDRKPEAPETAAKSTIHIEKSEVKTGGRRHRDAVEHDPFFPEHLPRPLAKALAFWSMTVEKPQIFWTMSWRRAYSLLSLYAGMFQRLGDFRHPAALETCDFEVIGARRRCLIVGDRARAIRRPGLVQGSIRIACRHNDKAEMRQRIIHREQGRFIAAMRRRTWSKTPRLPCRSICPAPRDRRDCRYRP